jgi:plasmid stability protein
LLIRNIDPDLKRQLTERARIHRCSLSEEVGMLLGKALSEPFDRRKMGKVLFGLVPEEFRGDDLVFEVRGDGSWPRR